MFYKGNEDREKRLRFSIRKVSFGAASVAVAALFMFPGNGTVSATEQGVTPTNEGRQGSPLKDPDVQNGTYGATPVVSQLDGNSGSSETTASEGQEETTTPTSTDASAPSVESPTVSKEKEEISTTATPAPVVSSTASATEKAEEKATSDLDKKQLEDYVAEIDAKLASGSYATKTDESVATLKEHLELAKLALTTATSQEELTKAYRKLLMTASSGLRSKPKAQVESPKLDTTEGKATVGKKASNTERATGTNSIANSGQHDPRNRQALDRNNPFRTGETTTDDPSANQTYTAPRVKAGLDELTEKLLNLPERIQNNDSIKDDAINKLGVEKNVEVGHVKEINDFGGWKAVGDGKFAIGRKTKYGTFPIETINSLLNDTIYLREQSFDKTQDYMLFLTKARTRANSNEEAFDGSAYKYKDEGLEIAKAVKGFDGIEKTFKAYSSEDGSRVKISFKPGYTGDIDGKKAKYKVEVFSIKEGVEKKIYSTEFYPDKSVKDADKTVIAAKDGTNAVSIRVSSTGSDATKPSDTRRNYIGRDEVEKRLANPANLPNGTEGTFTSRDIELEKGVDSYKVRISSADNSRVGMSYQAWDLKYALPISSFDFSIDQDTNNVAKNLLQKVYDKLLETRDSDKRGKTPETQQAYQNQLDAINQLLAGELKSTAEYKKILNVTLQKQAELKVDKSTLISSKASLEDLVNDDPTPGKTPETVEAYNLAKTAAEQEAEKAKAVIESDTSTVDEVAQAVANVKAARAELTAERTLLVVAATEAQKAKLEKTVAKLVEASTEGKTPDSIHAYNEKIRELTEELNQAKAAAEKIKTDGANATKLAALEAQVAVDEALAKLEEAKSALVEAATAEQKATLAEDASKLVEASKDGKTSSSIAAYEAKIRDLTAELEAAKAAAEAVKTAGENASKADAIAAQAKVNDMKAKLAEAATLLKDKANTTALETAKDELKAEAAKENVTAGKTPATAEKYDAAKAAADQAVKEAETVIGNPDATSEEVATALANVNAKKAELEKAKSALVDKITQDQKDELANADEDLKLADKTGKTNDSIKAYNNEVGKLSADLEAAKQAAKDLLAKGDNAGELEAYRLQAKISKLKSKLATAAKLLKDIDKSAVKKEVEGAAKNATDAIESNVDLPADKKAEAKAKVAEEANKSIAAIDSATTEDDVTAAKDAGKLAIAKEASKADLEAAQAIKEKVIAGNEKLSDDEKQAVKEQVQNVVDEAKKAIDAATEQVAVDNAKTTGKEAIDALNPVGKEKALDEIQKVTEAKLEAIDKNEKLSEKEKIKAKAEVAKAAIAVVEAINEATDQATVDAKVTEGTKAISSVAEVGKDQAKAAIDSALSAKETAIDANDKLSDAEKSAAKVAAKKAAEDAKKAIETATTQAEVDAKVTEGTKAISSVAEVGKDKAKAAVDTALSAKETAIDSNAKLSDAEKSAAKAVAKKAAEDAKKAIESATTQAEVDEAKTTGITAISAVNPVGKEKALAEIDTALAEKAKAIDARTDLLTAEKTTAKKAAESEAETAKDAIRKAMSQDDVAKVTEVGKANIAKIDPVGAKAEFKKAVEEVLADKLKEIDARTDLTFEDKNKKKELVNKVAAAAKQAIDSSTTQAELDKALRTFLYQVDQDALVADLPELKLEDALKALINGVVKVERGTALSQADVLAKLDLPEEISVLNMVLPDTNTVGTKVATVTLRLADGSVQKLEVPVEVILPNNQDMIPLYNGGNYGPSADNGMTNTQAKVNKSKLESAIHQLDELIIQESAKLDAETVKAANDLLSEAKTVSSDADATQAEVDAMVKRIEDFMAKLAPAADHVTPAEDQSVQTPAVAPATAQAANANQEVSAQANTRKVAKELPNTGTADSTVAMVAAAASALLGLGLAGRRRKEDEEA